MNKCRLCLNADATQTGSHIVPHFLIRRYENPQGEKQRGYEMGFEIGGLFSKGYVGRSVSPERIEPVYGEFTEEDIQNNKHPDIEDYYFCPRCEKRFQVIESIYSDTLAHFDRTGTPKVISSELGILFWCSVFWRLGIQRPIAMHFSDQEMELMRSVLDTCLPEPERKPDMDILSNNEDLKKLSYGFIRCTANEEDSKFFLVHPRYTKPHALVVADQIILFSLDDDYSQVQAGDFFGIDEHVKAIPVNKAGTAESYITIEPKDMKVLIKGAIELAKQIRFKEVSDFLDEVYREAGGPGNGWPEFIKREIWQELTAYETKLGRRYTKEDLIRCSMKVFSRYIPQN